jgi:hypothetical protein
VGRGNLSEFEILSNIDPDDEFLQGNRSAILLENICQRDNADVQSMASSEFSIISQNPKLLSAIKSLDLRSESSELDSVHSSHPSALQSLQFSSIHNDQRDIYIEDIVMQKIIFYVSLFSEDLK